MENETRLQLFWLAQAVLWTTFVLEMVWIVSVWLQARVPGAPAGASSWAKARIAGGQLVRLICSSRLLSLLRFLVADGLLHRKLARTDARRWTAHILLLGSWLTMGILSTVTGVAVEILPILGLSAEEIAAIPLLGGLLHADVWWVALLNETLGVLMLLGMGLVLYRRYVQRDPQLRTSPADTLVLVLIAFIVLSGFPTETFRLLADYTTPVGTFAPDPSMLAVDAFPAVLHDAWGPAWGVLGYQAAQLLGRLEIGSGFWRVLHNGAFWFHFASCAVLLYTLPFSRFFHAIMSPLVVAANTLRERERFMGQERAEVPSE